MAKRSKLFYSIMGVVFLIVGSAAIYGAHNKPDISEAARVAQMKANLLGASPGDLLKFESGEVALVTMVNVSNEELRCQVANMAPGDRVTINSLSYRVTGVYKYGSLGWSEAIYDFVTPVLPQSKATTPDKE